jgi:hypothetical protein
MFGTHVFSARAGRISTVMAVFLQSSVRTLLGIGVLFSAVLIPGPAVAQGVFAGQTAVGSAAAAQTVTISIAKAGTVQKILALAQGQSGYDFQTAAGGSCAMGVAYPVGQSCTVSVVFQPVYPGQRLGTVVLLDANGNTLGSAALAGSALGPIGAFVPGSIHTDAGDSQWIYAGDGGPSNASAVFLPFGIALDAAGNLYIADSANARIRKVTVATPGALGTMSTIAGNGIVGTGGDGGAAVAANLNNPISVALDGAGNVYLSDSANNAVRRVDAFTGKISTVAGQLGVSGYSGDGGQATSATLNQPSGITFDAAGNLYIADTGNHAIRKVTLATGVITTIAGNGHPGFAGDGGPATSALLNAPWSVTISPANQIYIADQNNNRIRAIDTTGRIATICGTGTAGNAGDGGAASAAQLNVPANVVMDVVGNLYIADSGNNAVRKINVQTGTISTIAGNLTESALGDGGPATSASLYGPYTLALDGFGDLYIADVFHNRVREVATNGGTVTYDPQRVGRISAAKAQVVENDGNAPLDIATVTAASNSAVDPATTTCTNGLVMQPLAQCVIGAEFAPTVTGTPVMGTIQMQSNAANSPGILTLSGNVLTVDPSTVNLSSSQNPSTFGAPVTFSVAVTSGGVTPTGKVTLLDGTSSLATTSLNSSGAATFTISTLSGGTHSVTASYAGDTNNAAGVSTVLSQVVQFVQAPTTTTLNASANPVDGGATLRLGVSVAATSSGSGNGAVNGTVTFMDGQALLGSAVVANGSATFSIATLAVGSHTIIATYSGSAAYDGSSSSPLFETVRAATSTTVLGVSANPVTGAQAITLSATLTSTGAVPTGTVSFLDGATLLGKATIASGSASLTLSPTALAVGTHTLTAVYGGDSFNNGSTSAALSEVVKLATTATVLSSSANPVAQGGSIVFTAQVTGNGGAPTGSVQFFDGASSIGTGTVSATGAATLTSTTLGLGTHSISATYLGDAFDGTSTAAPVAEVIQTAVASIGLSASANPAAFGSPVTFTVHVTGTGSQPTGSVTLLDGATSLGASAIDATGTATFALSTLTIGLHTMTAAYAGDANHAAVTSSAVAEQIQQVTTTSLVPSTTNDIAGTTLKLTAVVAGVSNQPVTGTVRFTDGATTLATVAVDNTGTAIYSSSQLGVGPHTLAAIYSGDTNDQTSASKALVETVTIATTAATLQVSANPAFAGSALTISTVITGNGGVPTGTVTFLDGTTAIGSAAAVAGTGASATASLTLSTLVPGVHTLTASYGGDAFDAPSVTPATSEEVEQKTTIGLASSANPSLLDDNVTITATVQGGLANSPATGNVTLTDGGSTVGVQAITSAGTATFTLASPALGTHTLVATYAGDQKNTGATSAPLVQTVTLRPTTNTFTPSSSSLSAGQTVTFTSVVVGNGPVAPTGLITFVSNGTALGSATLNASGVATLVLTPTAANYNVVAQYPGDALYAPSNSKVTLVTVFPTVQFTMTATPASITLKSGAHTTLNVSVTSAPNFADTLALGCAGLPQYATCTFSQGQLTLAGGSTQTVSVVVDTGDPLGAGPTAALREAKPLGLGSPVELACLLPGGLLGVLLWRGRRKGRRYAGLLVVLLAFGFSLLLAGCGNSLNVQSTPAGNYTFRVIGTGNVTGATQSGQVTLVVTQ